MHLFSYCIYFQCISGRLCSQNCTHVHIIKRGLFLAVPSTDLFLWATENLQHPCRHSSSACSKIYGPDSRDKVHFCCFCCRPQIGPLVEGSHTKSDFQLVIKSTVGTTAGSSAQLEFVIRPTFLQTTFLNFSVKFSWSSWLATSSSACSKIYCPVTR